MAQVKFTVLIESSASREKTWNVALWHNHNDPNKWESLALKEINKPATVV